MRQKLAIVGTILLLIGVLLVINAATYVGKEEEKDSELAPNRSTYHAGPTGTRALYDFLNESGRKVMRWRETPDQLLSENNEVHTFVIIGDTPLSIDHDQAESILGWVARGGRLVLVDRHPEAQLLRGFSNWQVTTEYGELPSLTIDPANAAAMTADVKPLRPVQPTLLTKDIDSVQPSKFAAAFSFVRLEKPTDDKPTTPASQPEAPSEETEEDSELENESPTPAPVLEDDYAEIMDVTSPAPVVHVGDPRRPLLIDFPHGLGRIIVLGDPYIFSNGGISLKDNLQLAINVLDANAATTPTGLIAFDEYHQGRGATRNAFVAYFSGTPILPLVGQVILLILFILWTRGRRFARPVPLPQVDRRSALEFVASMAELQQRAGAFDLALENIYSRTRRVLARYAGTDYNSSRSEIAARVAARSSLDARSLEVLMRQCEGAINGERISERQSILLAKRLREIERSLGLRMRARDIRQTQRT